MKRDIPYDYCENCLKPIKDEEDVVKYGDFSLCSEECVEDFKNLIASYDMRMNSREFLTKKFTEMNDLKAEHFKSKESFIKDQTDGI